METPTRSGSIRLRWLYVVVAIVGALGSAFWVERARDARMKTLERELRRLSEERSTERATTSERHGPPAVVHRTPLHDPSKTRTRSGLGRFNPIATLWAGTESSRTRSISQEVMPSYRTCDLIGLLPGLARDSRAVVETVRSGLATPSPQMRTVLSAAATSHSRQSHLPASTSLLGPQQELTSTATELTSAFLRQVASGAAATESAPVHFHERSRAR